MPFFSAACPKCGKQSTEYAEDKWLCLDCGNKFIYREEKKLTQVNSSLNIYGDGLYEFEIHSTPNNIPYLMPSVSFTEVMPKMRALPHGNMVLLLPSIFTVVMVLLYMISYKLMIVVFSAGVLLLWYCYRGYNSYSDRFMIYKRQEALYKKELANYEARNGVSHFDLLCPYCHNVVMQRDSLDPASKTLEHCLRCGRQYVLLGFDTYCLKK